MARQTDPDTRLRDWEEDGTVTLLHPGTPVTNYGDDDEDPFTSVGDGQAPLAHSDPTLVTSFDPSQARDSHGRWTKEAAEAARAKAHEYIKDNGPSTHSELAHHLTDAGIVPHHEDGVSLVHHLVDSGHLVSGTDEYGRSTLHIPSIHTAVPPATNPTHKLSQEEIQHHAARIAEHMLSTTHKGEDHVPIHALRAEVSHQLGADAASHGNLDQALMALRLGENIHLVVGHDLSQYTPQQRADSVHGMNETFVAVAPSRETGKIIVPPPPRGGVSPPAAPHTPSSTPTSAFPAPSPSATPAAPKPTTSRKSPPPPVKPTHTAAELDKMSASEMRQLAIELKIPGAKRLGARSLYNELLVRARIENSSGPIGHFLSDEDISTLVDPDYPSQGVSLSAEEISVLINSGELDTNAICRDSIGRFASCGAAGLPPSERRGVVEARMVHARHLVEQIRGTKTPDAATVKELANHLGTMTVAQLHSLKKEYGLSASGKNKAVLKEKLTARFSQKTVTAPTPTTGTPKASETTPAPSPSPPTPVHVPVGTFGTTKDTKWGHPDDETYAHEVAQKVLGSNATAHDLISVAGIPDGARVEVTALMGTHKQAFVRASGTIQTRNPDTGKTENSGYVADRTIALHPDGTRSIINNSFEGKGSGLAMFGRQVENATKWGFTHIETYAAGQGSGTTGERPPEGSYNGYYTWPRFGYNGKVYHEDIARMPPDVQRNANAAGGMISGVMSTKEGRDWWLGHGDSLNVKFDLTPGSYSQDTLNTYLKHRGILK